MVYNVGMSKKGKKLHKSMTAAKHRMIAFCGLAAVLTVAVVLLTGFKQTGYDRYMRLAETPEPTADAAPTESPAAHTPAPLPTAAVTPTPDAETEAYSETEIVIDGEVFAVLASREAAESLISDAAEHFEAMCAASNMTSHIENSVVYRAADGGEGLTSFDEAFALLIGEDTPLKVVSVGTVTRTAVIEHGVNEVYSDEYYEGTVFVNSYGRDGKNEQTLEYTYVNGVLDSTLVTAESSLYPAVMEIVTIGTAPVPEGDTTDGEFGREDCPDKGRILRSPITAEIVKFFGFYGGSLHNGVDYDAAEGSVCSAACAGRVISVMERGAYGLTVDIDHGDGFITRYAGLLSVDAAIGDMLSIGDDIGRVGDGGLHFETIIDGRPRNPRIYLYGLFDAD